ncbi:DNA-binding transcriptional MerR regulator [Nocardia tenerifensis]|uniref:DNA-binding transcriptional MerR regulator n=2 Tax=Nocardia tenerifensis TaxID=228006 RepID=A0A318KAL8_9NOCA|nr:MerR family transcriptional regulator [Nocardia tenerifensis]PXX71378.1 DNA-binding transcriptional MerR regulator [Nocardia tenerifensis]
MAQESQQGSHLPDPEQAVYGISVAADLAGIGVQTLRLYERHGLLTPARSDGGTRRYSGNDIARLRRIATLAATGVNIAGIGRILELEDANADLHIDNDRLRGDNASLRRDQRRRERSG